MRARARSFAALAGLWALASGVAQAADEAASVERGRALLANRAESGCVLCHVVPGFAEGMVSVQDEASQLCATLLPLAPGLRVLDAFGLQDGQRVDTWPNLMAGTAVFKLQRR